MKASSVALTANTQKVKVPSKVLMQVNKFVHPCERVPAQLKATDQAEFAKDYQLKENARVRHYLVQFDTRVHELFFGSVDGTQNRL